MQARRFGWGIEDMTRSKIVFLISSLVGLAAWGARDHDDAEIGLVAQEVLDSERIRSVQSGERQIHLLMDTLIAEYGAKANVEIGLVVASLFPDEYDAVIAKRAMFYSPIGAAELLKGFSHSDEVMQAVLGCLPGRNLHTFRLQSDQQFSVIAEDYSLPAVEIRRRGGGGPFYVMQGY